MGRHLDNNCRSFEQWRYGTRLDSKLTEAFATEKTNIKS